MDNILNYNLKELEEIVVTFGSPKFRARQLLNGLLLGKELQQINIDNDLKNFIKNKYLVNSTKIVKHLIDSKDGTKKYLFMFSDGEVVEGVLMKYNYGNTFCISSQVGCRMGCKFCASGLNGLIRNLQPGEMIEMLVLVKDIHNIVIMGSGEPLDNYTNVVKFLKNITDENSLNISNRNISVSTCGLVPEIKKLADENLKITLSISLHASNDEARKSTMPIANKYSIKQVIEAAKYYFEKTGRRVAIEYALIDGVNDNDKNAIELKNVLKGFPTHVNIINLNPVKERNLKGASKEKVYDFCAKLNKLGLSATVRRVLGSEINAACGQLRAKFVADLYDKNN